jgi:hypothetical protein
MGISYPTGSEIEFKLQFEREIHQIEFRVVDASLRKKRQPLPYTRASWVSGTDASPDTAETLIKTPLDSVLQM